MELKNFDDLLSLVPRRDQPLRVVLAGADSDELLQGVFRAQSEGLYDKPILVNRKGRLGERLERLGLDREPHVLLETDPGHSVASAAIDVVRFGDADVLMRGGILAHDFLAPLMDRSTGLRKEGRIMSHVTLATLSGYPRLLALADMAVIIRPDLSKKRAIIRNTVEALDALGIQRPKLALMSLVEKGTFRMQDTVEAQSLVYEQSRRPFVDAELWGPISYDLIVSKEAARMKRYECPWTGEFDGIIAPELTTANTLLKSWLIHAQSTVCGAVIGAQVPIAFTSRYVTPEEAYLSLAFCAILHDYYKRKGEL
jgi:phosphotransacetylase